MMNAQTIKQRTNIIDVIGKYTELKRSGKAHVGFCPLHDNRNTPAFAVWEESQRWKCFAGCGEGDAFDFIQLIEGVGFIEAKRMLSGGVAALPEPRRKPQPKTVKRQEQPRLSWRDAAWQKAAAQIIEQGRACLFDDLGVSACLALWLRGLKPETVWGNWLGYNPQSRKIAGLWVWQGTLIPNFDGGTVIAIKIKLGEQGQADYVKRFGRAAPKYIGVAGSDQLPYNRLSAWGKQVALIVEGEFDALLAQQYVGDLAACMSWNKSPSLTFPASMRSVRRLIVSLDHDGKGVKMSREWLKLHPHLVEIAPVPNPNRLNKFDLTDYWKAGGDIRQWFTKLLQETT